MPFIISVTMSQVPTTTPFSNTSTGGAFKPITTSTTIGAVSMTTVGQPQLAAASTAQSVIPMKDVNVATLCRHGQEIVQDVVQKTTEIFQWLKAIYVSELVQTWGH